MVKTDKMYDNKPISYSVEKDGYKIYLDGQPWISQLGKYSKLYDSSKSYEENCLLHIEALTQVNENVNEYGDFEERLARLEEKVNSLTYIEKALGDGVIEIIKKEEMSSGDYTNPIRYIDGMSVEEGKWYYLNDKDLPKEAIKSGTPSGFDDKTYLV